MVNFIVKKYKFESERIKICITILFFIEKIINYVKHRDRARECV
jgi:hypothetical protein